MQQNKNTLTPDLEKVLSTRIYRHMDKLTADKMPDPNLPLLISFSGGRTSALMAYVIMNHEKFKDYKKVCVFANTGKELEKTLQFVKKCDEEFNLNCVWIETEVYHEKRKASGHKIVTFETASREGAPFEEVIKKYGIPNQKFPHCTRELKLNPINSYMKSIGHDSWTSAIGLRFDEARRISNEQFTNGDATNIKRPKFYPLFHIGVKAEHVQEFWSVMPFDLGLKSYQGNCDLCWKKSLKKKLRILKEEPKIAQWYVSMEEKYGQGERFNEQDEAQIRYNFHRNGQTTNDLLEISKGDIESFVDPYDGQENACSCNIGESYEPEN